MTITTCRQIITDALETIGAKDMNREPTATQAAQGLRLFQQMVLNAPGMSWWQDIDTDADYTAEENQRVRVTTADAVTVTIPATVSSARKVLVCCNQITLACEGFGDRAPSDGARVHISDQLSDAMATYFYRADNAQWTEARGLTLDSEVPFSADFDEGLTAMLALRLAPRYGAQVDQITGLLATSTMSRMRARFGKKLAVGARFPRLSASNAGRR